jgi:hypothetical protein
VRRSLLFFFFVALLNVSAFAAKDDNDFPLVIHVTAVHMEQGQSGVSGSGSTDSNGNYSSSVSGGGSYTWKLYTSHIDGDNNTYALSTPRSHPRGGEAVAAATVIGTMGWGALFASARNSELTIGDYRGHWNKNGTLEIQLHDPKGKLIHQTFTVQSEDMTPPPPATPPAGTMSNLTVESNVKGADIEVDGAFVGNTPSTVAVTQGQHTITVKMKGYTDWSRAMSVAGSGVHLNAELEPKP